MFVHPLVSSFGSNMLLTDSLELAHLPDDQAASAESFNKPIQSKMVSLQ